MSTVAEQMDGFGANAILDGLFASSTSLLKDFVTVDLSTVLLGLLILTLISTASVLLFGLIESSAYSGSVNRIRNLDARAKASAHDPAAAAIYQAAYREEVAHFNRVHGANFRARESENPGHLWGYSPGGERSSSEYKNTDYETDFVTGSRIDDFCGPVRPGRTEKKKDSVWDAYDSGDVSISQRAVRSHLTANAKDRDCDYD